MAAVAAGVPRAPPTYGFGGQFERLDGPEYGVEGQNLTVWASGCIFVLPPNKLVHILCTSPDMRAVAWIDAPHDIRRP